MFYTHVSDQYGPFHTNVIHSPIRDATYVLDGLLHHESELHIEEHYTDTAGFTDHVFALCPLIGFRFAPRIRDLADKRLYVPGKANQWPALESMIGRSLNVKLIEQTFDEIRRLAASIKQGHVTASLILRKLSSYGTVDNPVTKSNHTKILNEYGWLWLNRDGSPTLLTKNLFPKLLGHDDSIDSRRVLSARLLAGETEFWRAYRRYSAVLHFVYLSSSERGGFTSDNFVNLRTLELERHFAAAMEQAFKPLGVYLNFWHSTLPSEEVRNYEIYLVNDDDRPKAGRLRLSFTDALGNEVAGQEMPFSLAALGAQSYNASLKAPSPPGPYTLAAVACPDDDRAGPTISSRLVLIKASAH